MDINDFFIEFNPEFSMLDQDNNPVFGYVVKRQGKMSS